MSEETEVEHVSLLKLRRHAMGVTQELNASETFAYEVYIQGYQDGISAANLEAANRVDPERTKGWTEDFLQMMFDPDNEVIVDNEHFEEEEETDGRT